MKIKTRHRFERSPKQRESGQATIESVLISVVLVGIVLMVKQHAVSAGWAAALTEGPWLPVQSMIENGVWSTNPTAAKAQHPLRFYRYDTPKDDATSAVTGAVSS